MFETRTGHRPSWGIPSFSSALPGKYRGTPQNMTICWHILPDPPSFILPSTVSALTYGAVKQKRKLAKGKHKVAPMHATKAYCVNGLELHSFLRSPLDWANMTLQFSTRENWGEPVQNIPVTYSTATTSSSHQFTSGISIATRRYEQPACWRTLSVELDSTGRPDRKLNFFVSLWGMSWYERLWRHVIRLALQFWCTSLRISWKYRS